MSHGPSLDARFCICGDKIGHGVAVATVSPLREPEPTAVARRSDPDTSWEAARSVDHIRESQAEVLALFQHHGPMTDEMARSLYHGKQSLSGFRTRRSELVDQGRLVDTGRRARGSTGRRMILWSVP